LLFALLLAYFSIVLNLCEKSFLQMFAREKDIACIMLRGAEVEGSPNTFSKGTDHQALLFNQEAGKDTTTYYTELYQLVYLIFRLHKPFVAYFNGDIGGNAAALGVNSTFRIATEDSVFYLPQTGAFFTFTFSI
jgi:enoyl-CoA hydratase/carnithine racemase